MPPDSPNPVERPVFTAFICPNCGEYELERGYVRGRCPGCDTFFAISTVGAEAAVEEERWQKLPAKAKRSIARPARLVEVLPVEDHQKALQAEVEKREEVEGERDAEVDARVEAQGQAAAAESKLSSAVGELERRKKAAERITSEAETEYSRVFWAGIVSATNALLDLLRDKGTEATCTHLKDLQVEGTEQGGEDGATDDRTAATEQRDGEGTDQGVLATGAGVSIEGDPGPELPRRCPSCDRAEPYGQRVKYCPDPWHEDVLAQQSTTGKGDCETCGGTRRVKGRFDYKPCPTCMTACPKCGSRGRQGEYPCDSCKGQGYICIGGKKRGEQ